MCVCVCVAKSGCLAGESEPFRVGGLGPHKRTLACVPFAPRACAVPVCLAIGLGLGVVAHQLVSGNTWQCYMSC